MVILAQVGSPEGVTSPSTSPEIDLEAPDPEETPRGQALLALKEIEFDRATGKLSDNDYAMLRTRYEAAAIMTLEGCANCGTLPGANDLFCTSCGTARPTTSGNPP